MLLNAPVFIRLTCKLQRTLQTNVPYLPFIHNTEKNTPATRDLFYALAEIVKTTLEENQDDHVNILLLQSFYEKYEALYSCLNDWTQQDPDEFYLHLMNLFQLIAQETNQMESYSKAFEITSPVSTNDGEPRMGKDHAIRILANKCDFLQYIDKHYTGWLPSQLWATVQEQQNGKHVPYPYPTAFKTRRNQHYLFTGAVSLNCDRYIAVVRRQDCVYLFNGNRLFDRFHIDYLPIFSSTVI